MKSNEREGTRAVLRHSRTSAYKVRQVLDQIRGQDVDRAAEILDLGDREAAVTVGKVLASAVANAVHNDGMDAEELYVSACYADEGTTLKRWRPRARGRATRIRKRTSHITIIVSRLPEDRIARRRTRQAANTAQRSRRVAGSRRRQLAASATPEAGTVDERPVEDTDEGTDAEVIDAEVIDAEVIDEEGTDPDDTESEFDETEPDESIDAVATEAEAAPDEAPDEAPDQETDGETADEHDEKGT
ncbi:MAG: 50S ribosomal protein L22 [Acidimicrobiales bacterium]